MTTTSTKQTKPEIDPLIEQARASQRQQIEVIDSLERRKEMPAGVKSQIFIEEDRLLTAIRRYCPECLEPSQREKGDTQEQTHTAYTGDKEDDNNTIYKGYEPVFDDNGARVMVGLDYLYRIPKKITDAKMAQVTRLSKFKQQASDDQLNAAGENLKSAGVGHLTEEKAEISKEAL